jgi:prepilin-type processing-associated H-X9-DG protein
MAGTLTGCQNNLRQMGLGTQMYSNDDRLGSFTDAVHDTNDNINFLYPKYVSALKVYVCPGTQNRIREEKKVPNPFTGEENLLDLTGYARESNQFRHQQRSFRFHELSPRVAVLHDDPDVHMFHTFGLKGNAPGPSQIWLIPDGDDPHPGGQNYPDPVNNHGETGGNVLYCDGHRVGFPRRPTFTRMSSPKTRSAMRCQTTTAESKPQGASSAFLWNPEDLRYQS